MDSFQFWLYVIIAVIYLIGKAMKKSNRQRREKAPPPSRHVDRETGEPAESQPSMTFEELLREITEGKKRKSEPPPQPARIPPPQARRADYVDYDDDIGPEERSLERVDYDIQSMETTRQVYEKAQREAELKSSLETLQSSIGGAKSARFESFRIEDKHNLVREYISELRTPSGMKKAVVLSEILKPKF